MFGGGYRGGIHIMSATFDTERKRRALMVDMSNMIACHRPSFASPYGLSDKTISKRLLELADPRPSSEYHRYMDIGSGQSYTVEATFEDGDIVRERATNRVTGV